MTNAIPKLKTPYKTKPIKLIGKRFNNNRCVNDKAIINEIICLIKIFK